MKQFDRLKFIANCIIRFCDHKLIVNTKDDSDEERRVIERVMKTHDEIRYMSHDGVQKIIGMQEDRTYDS